ncbi:MAG: hypothetical protein HQL53_01945 [Magnetococcales bacterium]|nr:hypothetical protein [Magnetococcales bacterium]
MPAPTPRLALFHAGDPSSRVWVERLAQRIGPDVLIGDLSLLEDALTMDAQRLLWNGVEMTSMERVFLYGFRYVNPVIPDAAVQRDWSVWRDDHLAEQQGYSAVLSFLQELSRRGTAVLNHAEVHIRHQRPFVELERLRMAGVAVPELLLTNEAVAAERFMARHQQVVWRPASGRGAWQRFTHRQQQDLVAEHKPPVMLAKVISGPLQRSYFLAGYWVQHLRHEAPDATPALERLERFQSVKPSPSILRSLAPLLAKGKIPPLGWGLVSYVVGDDGQAWIYDLDPDPRLETLPAPHRTRLLTALGGYLRKGRRSSTPSLQTDPQAISRPQLFLRRMLRILFEFEHSKYKPQV